ncbi:MAG: DUF1853 family protein [Lutibacter sp.]|uniref:DUF1853 family protein n=1 Tax=Lutibacter sp. TaxID=1925666 RepID=UPI00385AD378
MDLNSKDIQLQYEGFLNTQQLWISDVVFGLTQIEIPIEKYSKFNATILKNLRLGKRVERFVKNELEKISSIKIVAENVQIQHNKITVGEIDFIIQQHKTPIHLEVVYKFYLYDETVGNTELEHWIGPNRKDSLVKKLTKLKEKQLPLIFRSQTKPYLDKLQIDTKKIEQQVYFKAQLFVPYNLKKSSFNLINNECIKGFYISFDRLIEFKNCKFHIPTKINWLQKVQVQTSWKTYNQISSKIELLIQNQTSPLCWLKYSNGEVDAFFIVWW